MSLRCLLFGCRWEVVADIRRQREFLRLDACTRCDALRTVSKR